MRPARLLLLPAVCAVFAGCVATRMPAPAPVPWQQRLAILQQPSAWQLAGRTAVAMGKQGWQATLNWEELAGATEVRIAGPLGVGSIVLRRTPEGLSLNGAVPSGAVESQLEDRLGFKLPLEELHYWLLGVPEMSAPYEATRNAQDRLQHLEQAGWTIDYDQYMAIRGDLLPARLVLNRDAVRIRIAVDRWRWLQ